MTPLPSSSLLPRRDSHHRKRFAAVRLSSDTTATLPEYTSPPLKAPPHIWSDRLSPEPFEQPPDYPDSADEADEETDEYLPLSTPASPRRHRRFRSISRTPKVSYSGLVSASDTYLDSLLERSVNALELSNTLLQSSMSTQSSLSTVLVSDSRADRLLESRARVLTSRIRNNQDVHAGWMDDLDNLAKGVESMYGEEEDRSHLSGSMVSRSLPSSEPLLHRKRGRRRPSLDLRKPTSDVSQVHRWTDSPHHVTSASPRASRQYTYISPALDDSLQSTSEYLPSTAEHQAVSHVSEFPDDYSPPPSPFFTHQSSKEGFFRSSSMPPVTHTSRNYYPSRTRKSSSSHSSSTSSKKTFTKAMSTHSGERQRQGPHWRPHSRSRSRSWSSTSNIPSSPSPTTRPTPPVIAELPSQSDSSTSSSSGPHVYRTLESLRKILNEQPATADTKGKMLAEGQRSPMFPPRSLVTPVTGTSTTTTSISRLLTKGVHSTSTRAPSPPTHSSLRQKTPSSLSIPDMRSVPSQTSSGRSTPRQVAFGPLPESYASSKGGASSKFKEKKKGKSGHNEKKGESDGDNSWWKIWLTGGSGLSMSPARHEERVEERVARSWGRPGIGSIEEWAV